MVHIVELRAGKAGPGHFETLARLSELDGLPGFQGLLLSLLDETSYAAASGRRDGISKRKPS